MVSGAQPDPLIRVYTFGKFRIERLASSSAQEQEPSQYVPIRDVEWGRRNEGRNLLKLLICSDFRRATRDTLLEALWPEAEKKHADRYLNSSAWMLRKALHAPTGSDLLLTIRPSSDTTIYELAHQDRVWVDADAFLSLLEQVEQTEKDARPSLPLLEQAYQLARGEFLVEDTYHGWADNARRTVNAARQRCFYWLVDQYEAQGMWRQAETMLYDALKQEPADEDILCRLMPILVRQGRPKEALTCYESCKRVLEREQHAALLASTQALAKWIRSEPVVSESKLIASIASTNSGLSPDSSSKLFESVELRSKSGQPMVINALEGNHIFHPSTAQAYEDVLSLAWETFYTSSAQHAAYAIEHWLSHLTQQISVMSGSSRIQLIAFRCRFLQLSSVIASDRADFMKALEDINDAILIAFQLKNAELMASSLYRRAKVYVTQQQYDLAIQDLEAALPYASRSRDPLRCYVSIFLAETYSLLSPEDTKLYRKSLTLLDEVERMVRAHGTLEGDGSFAKVDIPGLFMIRGDVLRRSAQLRESRDTLRIVRGSLSKEFTRWQGNLCISEAQLFLAEGDINNSCQRAFEAFGIFHSARSRSNESKIHRLYKELRKVQPANPSVKELESLLK